MQDYLHQYAQNFMSTTIEEGDNRYSEILPAAFDVPVVAVTISVILFIIIVKLAGMMNRTIIEPVMNLANASQRIAANDFFIDDVKAENDDEIGKLVKAFNKMKYATGEYIMSLEERREVLDQLHAQEIRNLEVKKQLDAMNLALLKSQINPHFLFNTLNVIGGMANLEDAETTEKMIGALSSLFRYNLKTQDEEVILSQELKVATDYMYLQQMRFGSRVEFDTDCQVDAGKVMVPTFTFQPLLENSVIHGLTPKIEGGSAKLTVTRQGEMLCIVVSDTGVGMSSDKLCELKSALKDNKQDKVGIGVGNIYRRIYAMYEDGSMDIDSTEGEGTKVTIMIPYHTEINV
jgi:sensor histidine kinase YesM